MKSIIQQLIDPRKLDQNNYPIIKYLTVPKYPSEEDFWNKIEQIDSNQVSILKQYRLKTEEIIRLQNNRISDISVFPQLNFNRLKEINLSNNAISSLDSLSYIQMNNLKIINLSNNSFNANNFQNVLETLKQKNINVII